MYHRGKYALMVSKPMMLLVSEKGFEMDKITINDIRLASKPLLSKYGFSGAMLFGSYAKGTESANSDIDLFIQVPEGTKTKKVFAFAYDLGEVLGRNVDAYGSHEVPKTGELYNQIQMHGVLL